MNKQLTASDRAIKEAHKKIDGILAELDAELERLKRREEHVLGRERN